MEAKAQYQQQLESLTATARKQDETIARQVASSSLSPHGCSLTTALSWQVGVLFGAPEIWIRMTNGFAMLFVTVTNSKGDGHDADHLLWGNELSPNSRQHFH